MSDSALNLGLSDFPYPSRRMPLVAARGVVATSEPLAASAGLRMLLQGGNAVDAAIATAAALTVVEPGQNGIGSDAFAIVWDGRVPPGRLHGLNGSGRAPRTHTPELFAGLGLDAVPDRGWLPVTVPGTPAAWRDLHHRFGKLPFARLFEPAIQYAQDGYPVAPVIAEIWDTADRLFTKTLHGPEFRGWFETFAPDGRAPRAGAFWRSPSHARTLRLIAESDAAAFYDGEVADAIARFAAETGGYLTKADLAAHTSSWVEPISTNYRGFDVWEIPPNGQGITALIALNLLETFDVAAHPRESVETYHRMLECIKLAFADTHRYVADPEHEAVPVEWLLDKGYAAERRKQIGDQALVPQPGAPPRGDTVYLCAADGDGMMVSFIQSNFQGFGSGVVVPGTGVALQNRGHGFTLAPGHPNRVAPGKRPFHTIIPAFLTRDGAPLGPFGVMGGHMQPQGHVQVIVNQVDFGMNPQAALDAPRWRWNDGRRVSVEHTVAPEIVAGLRARGHEIAVDPAANTYGRGQIIRRVASGAYIAGSEPRADGQAVGY